MYYNLNILEDTGMQILNHQILIRISYLITWYHELCNCWLVIVGILQL